MTGTSMTQKTSTMKMVVMAAALGAAIGVLFAPKRGVETREDLKVKYNEMKGKAKDQADVAKSKMDEGVEKARGKVHEMTDKSKEVVNKAADKTKDAADRAATTAKQSADEVADNARTPRMPMM